MAGQNGGARPGAGRKPTGAKTKCYTITLSLDEALDLEKRAEQCGLSVNKYLRQIIRSSGLYGNVGIGEQHVDDSNELMAAEEVKKYV